MQNLCLMYVLTFLNQITYAPFLNRRKPARSPVLHPPRRDVRARKWVLGHWGRGVWRVGLVSSSLLPAMPPTGMRPIFVVHFHVRVQEPVPVLGRGDDELLQVRNLPFQPDGVHPEETVGPLAQRLPLPVRAHLQHVRVHLDLVDPQLLEG